MPTTDWNTTDRRHRHLGMLGVGVLHALIAAAWLAGRPILPTQVQKGEERRIQWLWLAPPKPAAHKPGPAPKPEPMPVVKPMRDRTPRAITPVAVPDPVPVETSPPPEAPPIGPAPPETASAEPPKPSAADLLTSARQMAGKVDKQLRKENHQALPALVDTPYKRFVAELEAAHVAQWTGRPTITEIAMPGTGERLVKVSNGSSSYCLRVPSPSMGIDQYERARNAVPVNCPH